MKIIEYIYEKKTLYLMFGFLFSSFSVGIYNFSLFIFIWPYCFLGFLQQNKSKTIPLIIVSLCLIFSNMIRWIGIFYGSIKKSYIAGLYFSVINIIPYIIDDLIYNKISKKASIFVFPY